MAISPHVMSTPNRLHTTLNGRLPTVVNGARYDLCLKSRVFFSLVRSGIMSKSDTGPSFS